MTVMKKGVELEEVALIPQPGGDKNHTSPQDREDVRPTWCPLVSKCSFRPGLPAKWGPGWQSLHALYALCDSTY